MSTLNYEAGGWIVRQRYKNILCIGFISLYLMVIHKYHVPHIKTMSMLITESIC